MKRSRSVASGSRIAGAGAILTSPSCVQETGSGTSEAARRGHIPMPRDYGYIAFRPVEEGDDRAGRLAVEPTFGVVRGDAKEIGRVHGQCRAEDRRVHGLK